MRTAVITLLLVTLTACGVQRPLVRPSDIPQDKQESETR